MGNLYDILWVTSSRLSSESCILNDMKAKMSKFNEQMDETFGFA